MVCPRGLGCDGGNTITARALNSNEKRSMPRAQSHEGSYDIRLRKHEYQTAQSTRLRYSLVNILSGRSRNFISEYSSTDCSPWRNASSMISRVGRTLPASVLNCSYL